MVYMLYSLHLSLLAYLAVALGQERGYYHLISLMLCCCLINFFSTLNISSLLQMLTHIYGPFRALPFSAPSRLPAPQLRHVSYEYNAKFLLPDRHKSFVQGDRLKLMRPITVWLYRWQFR